MLHQQTALRGYLLTGDTDSLVPFAAVVRAALAKTKAQHAPSDSTQRRTLPRSRRR
jgi:CHASE3 domain sensor protein